MLRTAETAIARFSMVLGGLVLLAMMLQVVVDVFMRSFVGAGFPATADLVSKYYMVAVSVLPLALTEIKRRHIEATIFTQRLTGTPRRAVELLGFVAFAAVLGILLYGSTTEAMRQTQRGAYIEAGTLHFATWPSYWIMPLSFGLALIVMLMRIYQMLTGTFDDHEHDIIEQVDALREDV